MINYGPFQFSSPPRTATTWFLRVCSMVGYPGGFKAHAHEPIPEVWCGAGLSISLVRHPYDWLVSWYYGLQGGAVGVPEVDVFAKLVGETSSFWDFVRLYLRRQPGAITRMFSAYHASSILRVEDLPLAAMELFKALGKSEKVLKKIEGILPMNVTHDIPYVGFPRLRRSVYKAEKGFYDRYEYTT